MKKTVIKIHAADNVAVAVSQLQKGTHILVDGEQIELCDDIPAGHKIALRPMAEGEQVVKYGFPIGHMLKAVGKGELIDDHNLKTNLAGLLEYTYKPTPPALINIPNEGRTFRGYRRANGEVGIRNELWIIPTVGCVNSIANRLAEEFVKGTATSGVDAVVAFTHNYGCSQLDNDLLNTQKILRGMVTHPNAGAVLVVGLGCENNQPRAFREMLGDYDTERIQFLICQEEEDEIAKGLDLLRQLYKACQNDQRTDVPLSELKVGLKCGGSDGFSGITANPLLGMFSDYLVAQGGTTVLTEVPEMFGAETILMNRCEDKGLFNETVNLINDFKTYFISHGKPVGENPSPGNKAGGISTLEEKSLGCIQKGGRSQVKGVVAYGNKVQHHGLNLLSAPGNDLVSSTALAAAGCQMVLFTTGRGTPFGTFVPTMKVATNTDLAQRKKTWMDFNAGVLLEDKSAQQVASEFTEYVIRVASGEPVNNERNGYRDFAIFKDGVTL